VIDGAIGALVAVSLARPAALIIPKLYAPALGGAHEMPLIRPSSQQASPCGRPPVDFRGEITQSSRPCVPAWPASSACGIC